MKERPVCEYQERITTSKGGSVPICNYPGEEGSACLTKCEEAHKDLSLSKYALAECFKKLKDKEGQNGK